jgi:DNA-binding transcriptional MerR regulator
MFTIGDFARLGGVSIRMLRHYDAIGLLRPARVDPDSGYRSYEAGQLGRLNRVIALKELGLKLQQVQAILDEEVSSRSCTACCGCGGLSWRSRSRPTPAGWPGPRARTG